MDPVMNKLCKIYINYLSQEMMLTHEYHMKSDAAMTLDSNNSLDKNSKRPQPKRIIGKCFAFANTDFIFFHVPPFHKTNQLWMINICLITKLFS